MTKWKSFTQRYKPYKKETEDRRDFYNFLERTKEPNKLTKRKDYIIDARKVDSYIRKRGWIVLKAPRFSNGRTHFRIENKRGTTIGDLAMNKRKKIDWWSVD